MDTLKLVHVLENGVFINIQADKVDGEKRVVVSAPSSPWSPRFDCFEVDGAVLPLRIKEAIKRLDRMRNQLEDPTSVPECGSFSKAQAFHICETLNKFFDSDA